MVGLLLFFFLLFSLSWSRKEGYTNEHVHSALHCFFFFFIFISYYFQRIGKYKSVEKKNQICECVFVQMPNTKYVFIHIIYLFFSLLRFLKRKKKNSNNYLKEAIATTDYVREQSKKNTQNSAKTQKQWEQSNKIASTTVSP